MEDYRLLSILAGVGRDEVRERLQVTADYTSCGAREHTVCSPSGQPMAGATRAATAPVD